MPENAVEEDEHPHIRRPRERKKDGKENTVEQIMETISGEEEKAQSNRVTSQRVKQERKEKPTPGTL